MNTNWKIAKWAVVVSCLFVVAQLLICGGVRQSLGFFNVFPPVWLAGFLVLPALCVGLLNYPWNWEVCAVLCLLNIFCYIGFLRYTSKERDAYIKPFAMAYVASLMLNLVNAFFVSLVQL